MKKGLIVIFALLFVSMSAGSALAYFGELELIRVVYDTRGGNEHATDLGNVSVLSGGSNSLVGSGADAFELADFPGATWGDLAVAYFAKEVNPKDFWGTHTSDSVAPASGNRKWSIINSATGVTMSYYDSLGGGTSSSVIGVTTAANSYWSSLNKNGLNVGEFGGYYASGFGEAGLADLGTTGYVDLFLYYFDDADNANPGVLVATIRTLSDGTTIINPIPIPASVLLLGSGLIGMIGIRRKKAADLQNA